MRKVFVLRYEAVATPGAPNCPIGTIGKSLTHVWTALPHSSSPKLSDLAEITAKSSHAKIDARALNCALNNSGSPPSACITAKQNNDSVPLLRHGMHAVVVVCVVDEAVVVVAVVEVLLVRVSLVVVRVVTVIVRVVTVVVELRLVVVAAVVLVRLASGFWDVLSGVVEVVVVAVVGCPMDVLVLSNVVEVVVAVVDGGIAELVAAVVDDGSKDTLVPRPGRGASDGRGGSVGGRVGSACSHGDFQTTTSVISVIVVIAIVALVVVVELVPVVATSVVVIVTATSFGQGSAQPPCPSSCMKTWNSANVEVVFRGVYQFGFDCTPEVIAHLMVS
mmetsp:Transcript_59361/g.171504  ORF Transcript_59361/g.171504 Transcript_59361/m.171504 type:complete len:333 (+) Transcript_59361:585-1583(+)